MPNPAISANEPGVARLLNHLYAIPTLTLKLGELSDEALQSPLTAPTGYGLGKSGWVTAPKKRVARAAGARGARSSGGLR